MAGFLCGRGGILAGLPAAIPAKLSDCRARRLRAAPRVARRLVPGSPLWAFVLDWLRRRLSPEQIASTAARMPEPVRLSHAPIDTALYAMPRGDLQARVPACCGAGA